MKTMEIDVADMRKATGDGKLKAFADVRLAECLTIKGVRVFSGSNGLFVSMPSKAGKDGKWFEMVMPDESLKREIENKVLESYDSEIGAKN